MNEYKNKSTRDLENFFDLLWPLNRSLTGNDVRKTHKLISKIIPINTKEIKSGRKVHDWTVPEEWNVRHAYIQDIDTKKKIVDFKNNNLHLLGYSTSFKGIINTKELIKNLFFIKKKPNAIPYMTSYYKKRWGMCVTFKQYQRIIKKKKYFVNIKTDFKKGSMTLSDLYIRGKIKKEILVHTYTCHPSMAINELSGPLLTTYLAKKILKRKNYFSYRFIFAPETIGTIAYLNQYGSYFKKNLVSGFVCTCLGLKDSIIYKKSKKANSIGDLCSEKIIKSQKNLKSKIINFHPSGSDERQYCSIGYNLPVGSLMSYKYGSYPEYHTSLDNKKLISFNSINNTINIIIKIFDEIENSQKYSYNKFQPKRKSVNKTIKRDIIPINLIKKCEPQLSKYKINYSLKNHAKANKYTMALKWLIHYSDGKHSLKEISNLSNLNLKLLSIALKDLCKNKIFKVK